METLSALLAICAGNSPMTGEFPAQRPVTRSFDVIFAWINGWVNNGEAGDLRRHRVHYDVNVMMHTVHRRLVFMADIQGLGLLIQFPSFRYFPKF